MENAVKYVPTRRQVDSLVIENYLFQRVSASTNKDGSKGWRCREYRRESKCQSTCRISATGDVIRPPGPHNHPMVSDNELEFMASAAELRKKCRLESCSSDDGKIKATKAKKRSYDQLESYGDCNFIQSDSVEIETSSSENKTPDSRRLHTKKRRLNEQNNENKENYSNVNQVYQVDLKSIKTETNDLFEQVYSSKMCKKNRINRIITALWELSKIKREAL